MAFQDCAPTTGSQATQDTRHTMFKLGKRFQPPPQSTHPEVLVLSLQRRFGPACTPLTWVRTAGFEPATLRF
jgi:hypothetical protein